ncbi:MAG: putative D-isomer specific 2-hydroxyacid dehydrogenase NAD-binding [Paenibacillus sp.]|nr:putative D-isomer specific 2-hydroxyacid dehydrogenase NAD-binding [Paenibacillus sp.]
MSISRLPLKILNMAEAPFAAAEFERLREFAEVVHRAPDQQALEHAIGEFDVYFCSLKVRATRSVLEAGQRLKAVASPSTGLDHIDVEYARSRGIALISLRDDTEFLKQITATAELCWGLLLGVVRKLPWGFEAVKNGDWGRDRFRGMQLSGKTLGIVGFGRLGRIVAEYALSFRMRVVACDPLPFAAPGVERVSFDELLARADVVSVHVHLTPDTTKLLDRDAFARMKDGVYILNTSRGAIIDEAALLEALQSGKVAGAGLDVIDGEWSEDVSSHPLVAYSRSNGNVLISPHIGGVTLESQTLAYRRTVDKLLDYLRESARANSD